MNKIEEIINNHIASRKEKIDSEQSKITSLEAQIKVIAETITEKHHYIESINDDITLLEQILRDAEAIEEIEFTHDDKYHINEIGYTDFNHKKIRNSYDTDLIHIEVSFDNVYKAMMLKDGLPDNKNSIRVSSDEIERITNDLIEGNVLTISNTDVNARKFYILAHLLSHIKRDEGIVYVEREGLKYQP